LLFFRFPILASNFHSGALQELPTGRKERLNRALAAALLAGREKHPECCGMSNAESPDAVP
jgi:hypothetical protein